MSLLLQPGPCCGCESGPGVLCGSCAIPQTLSVTDVNATFAFTYSAITMLWTGCYVFNPGQTVIQSFANGGICANPGLLATLGAGSIAVYYTGQCVSGSFQVTQQWAGYFVQSIGGNQTACGSYDPAGGVWNCFFCSTPIFYFMETDCSSMGMFPDPINQAATVNAAWSTCSPFAWSQSFPVSQGSAPWPSSSTRPAAR